MKEEENEASCRVADSFAATRKLTIKLMLEEGKIGKMKLDKLEVEDSKKADWLERMVNNEGGSNPYKMRSTDYVVVAGGGIHDHGGTYAGGHGHDDTFTPLGGAKESQVISLKHLSKVTGVAKVRGPRPGQGGKGFHEEEHAIEKQRLQDARREQVLAEREERSKLGKFENVLTGKFQ
jgi:hypothetical protein